jgi:prepilin-type N-terminal cleavage/methylation domain-containing protein
MKKLAKGFTLVELLVVIGILGVLMSVLYPAISSVQTDMNMKTLAISARKIVQGIASANTDRSSRGKPSLWPHNDENDGKSDDTDDIGGQTFGTSTEYFKVLFDIQNQTSSDNWNPYIEGYEGSWLSGAGVPPAQPGNLLQANVAWTIASGLTDDQGDFMPALVSRNTDTSEFATSGQNDMSTKTTKVTLGKKFPQPLGTKGSVIATKGGGVDTYKARDCRLKDVYKSNSFAIPNGITLKYLEP